MPENYQKPSTSTWGYFKPAKGENRLRIVTKPIVGYVDWDYSGEKPQPVRTRELNTALNPERNKPKHFWAMWVLHNGEVKVWEVTQSSIQDWILSLSKDEDWGNPMEYDIVVTRTGESMETKYTVVPKPKRDITEEEHEVLASSTLNLEALFDWGNPFEE